MTARDLIASTRWIGRPLDGRRARTQARLDQELRPAT
jgi:hypothetical protein